MPMASAGATRRIATLPGVLAAALVLLSCGGGASGDEPQAGGGPKLDAVKLVAQASGPNAAARSGRIDGTVQLTLTGNGDFAEPFSVGVSGPFRYRKGAALPDYELQMGARDNGVGLTSLRGRSWVRLGSTGFAVPAEIRSRLVRASARGRNGLTRTLEQFGLAPWRWETEQRVAGTERVDGVAVYHVTTSFNAGRILKDANTLLGLLTSLGLTRATGLPDEISRRARRIVVAGVTLKRGASWIGVKDKVLRKAGFTMRFTVPRAERAKIGGISGGTVVGALSVTEVGRPQRISAPATTGPYSDFQLGVDALGDARGG
jgi:hypothetical protein